MTKIFQAYDVCTKHHEINQDSIDQYKNLLDEAGGSELSSIQWNSQFYDAFRSSIQLKKLANIDGFFNIDVRINPNNNTNNVFTVSTRP